MQPLSVTGLIPRFFLLLLCAVAALAPRSVRAQELVDQTTPFSVWLDFQALASAKPPKVALPVWLESLQSDITEGIGGQILKTTYRLRFRPEMDLNREMLLRVFFDDVKGKSPIVTGWTETGGLLFEQGPFGAGLHLPTSATVALTMKSVSYIDIAVPGDGGNVRGAFLGSLRRGEVRYPLDFAAPPNLADGFDNLPSVPPPADDTRMMGRVRATLDTGVVTLRPREVTTQIWEFELASAPLLAVLGFEILNADPLSPMEISVNGQALGPAATHLPDLADPGYQGVLRPLDRGVRFRYAGWLQCQKTLPGSALHAGLNRIEFRLPAESGPVAIRSLDLQLKTEWQNLDSIVTPTTP
jgi:hypothetical protein